MGGKIKKSKDTLVPKVRILFNSGGVGGSCDQGSTQQVSGIGNVLYLDLHGIYMDVHFVNYYLNCIYIFYAPLSLYDIHRKKEYFQVIRFFFGFNLNKNLYPNKRR